VIQKRGLFGRISRRGMIVMVVLSLYFGFTSTGVDNAAHLGGLLCGFLLQMILRFPSVKKAKTVT
jgi:rhomboid protease GluP